MPDNKYLWRASVRGVPRPVYLVAQNVQSASAQLAAPPGVDATDLLSLLRIDAWDEAQNITTVPWPEPEP